MRPRAGDAPKKMRDVNSHTAFITYGHKCLPAAWLAHMRAVGGLDLQLVQAYKRVLPAAEAERFVADVTPVLEEINADPARKRGNSKKLVELLKARDTAAGVDVHPAFAGFKVRRPPFTLPHCIVR
jgi:hypothetical protein